MSPCTYQAKVKLTMANGTGTIVFDKIKDANVPSMIISQTGVPTEVNWTYQWDEGFFSHDLYLTYTIKLDPSEAVRNSAGVFKGLANFFGGSSANIVRGKLESGIADGFAVELSGCGGIVCGLKSCSVSLV